MVRHARYLFAVAGLAALMALRPAVVSGARWEPELSDTAREQVNSSAFATILGEIRASAADLMWVKTERYMHNGVAFSGHLDENAMARTGEVAVKHDREHGADGDEHDGCGHTLIPDASGDYRGFVGALQREVHPWQPAGAPHLHSAGEELLPWYRMLTYSNPRHWRGYAIGTWWLSRDPAARAEAESFIAEGVKNNPGVFQLQLMRGRILMQREAWSEAIAAFRQAAALAEKTRPAGGKPAPPAWSASDEEDYAAALRYIPLLEWRKLNDPAAARADLAAALERLPGDKPLGELRQQLK
ncbi:MAG: hypothetical protein ABFD69_08240 [Candidatus Sumerlaeia bacterium]